MSTPRLHAPGLAPGLASVATPPRVRPHTAPSPDGARPAATPPPPPRSPGQERHARPTSWRSRLTSDRVVGTAVFAGALTAGLWNVTDATGFQDDEGTYTAQALAAFDGTLGPYTYWYDHPPFGWFQIAALAAIPRALGVGDGSGVAVTRVVAGLLFAVTVLLVHLLARRLRAPQVVAVLAAILVATSSLALTLGRQVFLDNVAVPWVLLAVWLALSPRRTLWAHVGAGAALGAALLTKLTFAAFGPAVLLALVLGAGWRDRRSGRRFSLTGFVTAGALVFLFFPLMALLRGELVAGPDRVSLETGLRFQLGTRATSGSFWDEGSDRHTLMTGWFEQAGVLVVAGVVGALICALVARTWWVPVALLGWAVPAFLGQGYLPAMYVIGLLPFLAIAAAAGATHVWRAVAVGLDRLQARRPGALPRRARGALTASVAVVAVAGTAVAIAPDVRERSLPLATAQANQDWRDAVAWIDRYVPATDDVVVPFSAWEEVQAQGRGGAWNVIALEKVDLDSEFAAVHPQGWRDLEWILQGPTVEPNIDDLDLVEMRQALDSSRVVASFGDWHVREIVPGFADTETSDQQEEQP